MQDEGWRTFGVSACTALSVCGRSSFVMERVEGRQLTPKEFEILFLRIVVNKPSAVSVEHIHSNFFNSNDSDSISIGKWLDQSGQSNLPFIKELVHECSITRCIGASV